MICIVFRLWRIFRSSGGDVHVEVPVAVRIEEGDAAIVPGLRILLIIPEFAVAERPIGLLEMQGGGKITGRLEFTLNQGDVSTMTGEGLVALNDVNVALRAFPHHNRFWQ